MKKAYGVNADEWYPCYNLTIEVDTTISMRSDIILLTPEEKADYDRVMKEFDEWQNRLAKSYKS